MESIVEKAADCMTSARVSHEMLREKLSEFLAVEKGGLKLYDGALRIVSDPEVSKKFHLFWEQTRKHETVLTRVIQQLGMDPTYISSAAKVATEKALLKTMTNGLSDRAAEINAIENIILAETKDHADWELLGKSARQTDDSKIRDALNAAVSEVEPEEDTHLHWTQEQFSRLEMGQSRLWKNTHLTCAGSWQERRIGYGQEGFEAEIWT